MGEMKMMVEVYEEKMFNIDKIRNKIIHGNALDVLKRFPSNSIDMAITSPPYWMLRKYDGAVQNIWGGRKDCDHDWVEAGQYKMESAGYKKWATGGVKRNMGLKIKEVYYSCKKCGAFKCSLGLEPTIEMYVEHLCMIFNELKRVLKPYGSLWVNIGDKYIGKGLAGVPEMFVLTMTHKYGWIRKNTIIWHKSNVMPESVKNRFTVDFEYLYMFVKSDSPLFYVNLKTLKAQRERPAGLKGKEGYDWDWKPCVICRDLNEEKRKKCVRCGGKGVIKKSNWRNFDYYFVQQFKKTKDDSIKKVIKDIKLRKERGGNLRRKGSYHKDGSIKYASANAGHYLDKALYCMSEFGTNMRCVWTIATEPVHEAHFAVFPKELLKVPIKACCPTHICKKCGLPRVKVYDVLERIPTRPGKMTKYDVNDETRVNVDSLRRPISIRIVAGTSDCGCNAGFKSGIVLDPFMGSGTTAIVAKMLGVDFIGIDVSKKYIKIAYKRLEKLGLKNQKRLDLFLE